MGNCFVSILDQTLCRDAHTTIDIQERPTSRDTEMSESTGIVSHHAYCVVLYYIGSIFNQPISQNIVFRFHPLSRVRTTWSEIFRRILHLLVKETIVRLITDRVDIQAAQISQLMICHLVELMKYWAPQWREQIPEGV